MEAQKIPLLFEVQDTKRKSALGRLVWESIQLLDSITY